MFKKKKLKHMQIDPKHQKTISNLEFLLVHKKNWQQKDVEKLFIILHDNFEVASIYGYQIETAILEFLDMAVEVRDIQLAAMCMSRFVNIKKSNGTVLLQTMLDSLVHLGKEYFDYFNVSSNLSDISRDSGATLVNFTKLTVTDQSKWTLLNRITFIIYTIQYIFEVNYDQSITVPYDRLIRVCVAFLSTSPCEVLAGCDRAVRQSSKDIPHYLSAHLWQLLSRIASITSFKSLLYDHVPSIAETMTLCLTEPPADNARLYQLYIAEISGFLAVVIANEGRYCMPSLCRLVPAIIGNIDRISVTACSAADETILIGHLRVLNDIMAYRHDGSVKASIEAQGAILRRIRTSLQYLQDKSIYGSQRFTVEHKRFESSVSNDAFDLCKADVVEKDYFCVDADWSNLADESVIIGCPLGEESVCVGGEDVAETGVSDGEVETGGDVEMTGGAQGGIVADGDNDVEMAGGAMGNADCRDEQEEVTPVDTEELLPLDNKVIEVDTDENMMAENHDPCGEKVIDLEEMLRSFVPY